MKTNYKTVLPVFCAIFFIVLILVFQDNRKRKKLLPDKQVTTIRTFRKPTVQKIPKILHFIWNNLSVPNEFAENIKGYVKNNPTPRWTYYYWTKESGMLFIKQNYEFLYAKIADAHDMFRADVLRYLLIHEFGGVYFDLDTVSVKPLDDYVDSHECSITNEPGEHLFLWNVDLLINNGALLCIPGHPFFKHIIFQLMMQDGRCKDAFSCTGPMFLTNLYRNLNRTSGKVSKMPLLEPSDIFQDIYDASWSVD